MGKVDSDGFFFVRREEFWKLTGKGSWELIAPTQGAKVDANVLVYPEKKGRQLQVRFFDVSENEMNHDDAARFCKIKGLRMPTIQELFDFCVAETERSLEGRYQNHRCKGRSFLWSVSLLSENLANAWEFGGVGSPGDSDRYALGVVRCVGI
jgi:hypothetical protein